jgi:UDP-N-acetylmuramate: L-alanyl-gamma-D-glutamyl-meso-diaminopimelate ligase
MAGSSESSPGEKILDRIDPAAVKRIHLLGIAGTGMGSFAGLLKAAGYEVTGSDEAVYPPMSQMLTAWGISTMTPYRPENLDLSRPDLVIVGNVIRRVNPEATAMRERGIPHASFPAALGSLFLESRHSVVVAGTHGKTTTAALIAHVLVAAGRDASFLVGGVSVNFGGNFRLGKGPHFVIEGDEYDTAYFDKGPKFLHYRPRTALITSVEFDHADIYKDEKHYESAFERFAKIVPTDGLLVACATYAQAVAAARLSSARVETYSVGQPADWTADGLGDGPQGLSFIVRRDGKETGRVTLPINGRHNAENALGAYAVCASLGLTHPEISAGFATFHGVRRRQEIRGEPGGVLVIDDFAHHPTAVRETIAAVRARFPTRRLWAVFEPRSNTSRRNIHQEQYACSFGGASRALIAVPAKTDRVPTGEELDVARLATDVTSRGVPAEAIDGVPAIVDRLVSGAKPDDVILVMSNGSFGGLIDRLVTALGQNSSPR